MPRMSPGFTGGLIGGTIVVIIGYLIAAAKKGRVATATLGNRQLEVRSPASPEQVFAAIAALGAPYTVDDKDANARVLVLSSPVTFFSWGFLYPVFLHQDGAGTRIQVGCHSRFFQYGPVVTNAHKKCVAAIEQALSIPSARVA
jgi:hypothetical protein